MMTKGSFEIVSGDDEDFNIKPLPVPEPIPEAEVAVPRELFRKILRLIDGLRPAPLSP